MNKPTFLYIGPDKAGSTWIFRYLRQHPHVFVPVAKDIYFFDKFYEKGLNWYYKIFSGAKQCHAAIGEISHDYLYSEVAAERIRQALPDVKIIACLRDPISRSYSHYKFLKRSGLTSLDLCAAIERHPEIIENSRYKIYLQRYFELFNNSNILILDFSDLEHQPIKFSKDICDFLGVPHVMPDDLGKALPMARARWPFLVKALRACAGIMRPLGLHSLVGRVKYSRLINLLFVEQGFETSKDFENEMALLRSFDYGDKSELEKMVGISFRDWRL